MKKYQYLASWDDQTLTRVGEPVVVLGDSNVSQVEVILPSNFLLDPTGAVARMYFLLPGEKESGFETLETATKDENGDSHVTWTIKHVHSQKGGRLAFSLTLIGDDAQWDSRTAIIPVYESRYQPESEEAEEPYTGRLDALEGSMAAIRGEFTEVQDDFEELKETATLGTPIPESLVANMQEGRVYIYTGTEPGYTAGHVYYYVGGALTDGGVYGGMVGDVTLTQPGAAADAKVTGDKIAEIKEDLSDVSGVIFTQGDALTASATSNNYALAATGLAVSDSTSQILKYRVTAGDVLYLTLSADNATTYQWQDSANVDTSGTPVHLIGNPVTGTVDDFVKVPADATYLIVSQLQSNTTNVVATASTIVDDVEAIEAECDDIRSDMTEVKASIFTQGDALTASSTGNDYALTGTGLATRDSSSQLLKYKVTVGSTLYLSLSADNAGTYQFQNNASVPDSDTNANLIGNPVTGTVDDFVKVPADATYLIVSQFQTNTTNVVASAQNAIEQVNSDIAEIETLTTKLKNAALVAHDIDWTDYSNVPGYIAENYVWRILGTRAHVALDTSGWERVKIQNEGSSPAYYAFLASYGGVTDGGTPDYSAGHARRYTLAAGETVAVDMPTDAAYLYVMTNAPSGVSRPSVTYYSIDQSDMSEFEAYKSKVEESLSKLWNAMENSLAYGNSDSSIKDIPKNQGVRNAIKKIQQMNNIQWTTKGQVPYTGGGNYRDVGATYTGLPYTIPVETQTMVGEDVSFETFMTAANNPYSVLYTENINGDHSASAIGNTYHGTNRGAYYGTMCSGLVWYALGMDPLQRYINYLVDCGTMEYVYDNSATGVQLMDVLLLPKHFAIVYEITRDSLGEPTEIIVKEAWAQTILTRVYTPEAFNDRLGRTGKLARYKDLYKNLEYTPSPFVAVGNETIDTPYVYNNDICTNYGDKAVINQGKYLGINYNLDGNTTGYTQMIVRQGNTDIQTYALDANSHLINITALNLTPGLYTAVLSNGTTESEPTYFEIAHAEVTEVTIDGRIMTVKFATDYGTPQYVRTCDIAGMPLGFYELTEDDITAGECSLDYVKLYNTQFPEYEWPDQPYVRVCNVNEYGKMSSDMVPFTV